MATYSRRRLIRGSLILVASVVLNACGQKGPLYFPEDNEEEKKKNNEKSSALGRRRSSHV
ncbi:MAG: lipoprotein [Gammaproteobacteria bacterium]|nr:lipoprotein [Gammaproteobacteria bacterium]MDH3411445.1 lipoprotein [Gammaproteobacteria bacterium]